MPWNRIASASAALLMHSIVRDANIYSQLGAVTEWSVLSAVGQQMVLAISMKPP